MKRKWKEPPNHYEKAFPQQIARLQETEEFGGGREKTVYRDPDSDERLLGVYTDPEVRKDLEPYRDRTDSRVLKESYYVGKIAHVLFPNHVTTIHQVTTGPATRKVGRVQGLSAGRRSDQADMREITQQLVDAGFEIDGTWAENFIKFGDPPHLVYVDEVQIVDFKKVHQAIIERLQGHQQKSALAWLERAQKLGRRSLFEKLKNSIETFYRRI